jgi:DNA-directed RNA polymerase I, II, and III subunit RPABC1
MLDKINIARRNVQAMLLHREYHIVDDERLMFKNKKDKFLKVFICLYSKLNIERIKAYIQELEQSQIKHCIIIYDDVITSSCKKILEFMVRFTFETFHLNEMQYDLTQHVLYNIHEKLPPQEVSAISCIKSFPVLLKSDPVCRYFHFQRGDVIRVRRKNGVIVYRVVR